MHIQKSTSSCDCPLVWISILLVFVSLSLSTCSTSEGLDCGNFDSRLMDFVEANNSCTQDDDCMIFGGLGTCDCYPSLGPCDGNAINKSAYEKARETFYEVFNSCVEDGEVFYLCDCGGSREIVCDSGRCAVYRFGQCADGGSDGGVDGGTDGGVVD